MLSYRHSSLGRMDYQTTQLLPNIRPAVPAFHLPYNLIEFNQRDNKSRLAPSIYIYISDLSEKRNVTDEKQALNEALVILETQGLGNGKLFFFAGNKSIEFGEFGSVWSVAWSRWTASSYRRGRESWRTHPRLVSTNANISAVGQS
jgi:hypothetical protein